MNRMQQDLRDLGVRLWPDDAPLWPRDSVAGQITIEARPRLVAATLGAITFVVVFGVIALSLVLAHSPAAKPNAGTAPPTSDVIRVEIQVPANPLTFHVSRGTILALHYHLRGTRPESAWSVGTATGRGIDFQPVRVPYPGVRPVSSATDFYIAFRIPSEGSTTISVAIPVTCPSGVPCLEPFQLINVLATAPPMRTGTVTGELTRVCASAPASSPGCLEPATDAVIAFRNGQGETIIGAKTDGLGDYFAELPPGTWQVSTTPPAVPGQASTVVVSADGVVIANLQVSGL